MSEPDQGPEEPEILARLPRSRPGRRSPRRDEAARARERRAERAARASSPGETSQASAPKSRRAKAAPAPEQPGAGDAIAGLARTGVAVASGTVGLGLRAAGGALRAIRGTVDRR